MPLVPWTRTSPVLLTCVLMLIGLTACRQAYRFQYHYVMTDPPGDSKGRENARVRIHVTPVANKGILQLDVTNKSTQPIAIVWEQTHFIDPHGRRQDASETGTAWFFRPAAWLRDQTAIAPGGTFRARIQAGAHQSYNPVTVSRQSGGAVQFSTSARALVPTSGATATLGEAYQGREFQFILALRTSDATLRYPFTFRITQVDVQSRGRR